MGFFFYIFIAIIAYVGYRVYRHPYDARADPSDPNYKDEFRMLFRELLTDYTLTDSEESSVFEDKLDKRSRANSVATARSSGSTKLGKTPTTSASSENRSGKKLRPR